jgi:hypothetical protein
MCVLTIKKDEMLNPLQAKARIVVLENHEDRVWSKPEKHAPVICPDSICLMVSTKNATHCTKEIAKTHFVRLFSLTSK